MKTATKIGVVGICMLLAGCENVRWSLLPPNYVDCRGRCTIDVPVRDTCPSSKPEGMDIRLTGIGTHTITWELPDNSEFVFANEGNNFKGPIYLRGDRRRVASDPADRTDRTRVKVLRGGRVLEVSLDRLEGDTHEVQYFLNLEHTTKKYPGRPSVPPRPRQGEWCEIDPWIVDR